MKQILNKIKETLSKPATIAELDVAPVVKCYEQKSDREILEEILQKNNGASKEAMKEAVDAIQLITPFVGVQALTGPVGQIFVLRYLLQEEKKSLHIVSKTAECNVHGTINGVYHQIPDLLVKSMIDAMGKVAGDHCAETVIADKRELMFLLNAASRNIRDETYRGSATYIIMNHNDWNAVNGIKGTVKEIPPTLEKVGALGDTPLYISKHQPEGEIFTGYKGGNGNIDVALFYTPYAVNKTKNNNEDMVYIRGGFTSMTASVDTLTGEATPIGDSKKYIKRVKIKIS